MTIKYNLYSKFKIYFRINDPTLKTNINLKFHTFVCSYHTLPHYSEYTKFYNI